MLMEKTYTVHIEINKKIVYTVDVVAYDEDQAREFAYDMFIHDSEALVEGVDYIEKVRD